MKARGDPSIVIDCSVAKNFKILSLALARSVLGIGIAHRNTVDRHLGNPIDTLWHGDASCFEDRRSDIYDVVELRTQRTLVSDLVWPFNRKPISCATEVRGNLLHPLKWRIERPGPSDIEMVLTL